MDSASIYQIAVAEQQHNVPRAALFRALLRGLCELSIDKLSLGYRPHCAPDQGDLLSNWFDVG